MNIIFIRGLNTYNDDNLHLGPVHFGPSHQHLSQGFKKRNVSFTPLLGLGSGRAHEQAHNAYLALEPWLQKESKKKYILLAHSMGGIVAKHLLLQFPQLQKSISALITLATPHKGSLMAERALQMASQKNFKYQLLKTMGYDLKKRQEPFLDLTQLAAQKVETEFQQIVNIKKASFSFSLAPKDMSWPAKLMRQNSLKTHHKSDGLIALESQKWNQQIDHLELDHISQLGFFYFTSKVKKQKAYQNFESLLDQIVKYGDQLK